MTKSGRDSSGRFVKGNKLSTGNKGGISRIKRLLDELGDDAVKQLKFLLTCNNHSLRLAAAMHVLDRILGKPGQNLEVSGGNGQPLVIQHKLIDAPPEETREQWLARTAKERAIDVTEVKQIDMADVKREVEEIEEELNGTSG